MIAASIQPSGAGAQVLRGIVSDSGAFSPIDLGTVLLIATPADTITHTITDEQGFFSFDLPSSGEYYLVATALGYQSVRSEEVFVGDDEVKIVEISMAAAPLPVEGVVVEAQAGEPRLPRLIGTGFYDRMAEGKGEYITPGQIASSTVRFPQQLFWGMKTVRVFQGGTGPWSDNLRLRNQTALGYCDPAIYIDGVWLRYRAPGEGLADIIRKVDLDAVEVYQWPFGVPSQYPGNHDCGVVLFWTKDR